MLKCRDIALQASDYVDGEMPLRQRLAFGLHLLMCGRCRVFLAHLRLTIAYLKRLPDEPITVEEAARIAGRAFDNPTSAND